MGSAASQQASSTLPVVLIVGGGYGGSKLAQQLDASRKARVVLIDRKNYFLHNVAGLRAAVQKGFADNVLIPYDSLMKNGGVFVRGTVITINPDHVVIEAVTNNNSSSEGDAATSTSTSTSSSSSSSTPAVTQVTLRFDYLVIATGSSYAFPSKVSVTEAAEAKKMYDVATQQIQQARKVTVVGGGAVGVELATEIAYTYKKDINDGNKSVTLIHSHTQLLNGSRLSAEFHRQAMQKLESKKINVVLNERVDLNQRVSVSAPSTLAAIAGASSHYFFAPAASSADSFSSAAPTAITLTTDKGTNIETDLVLFATGTKVNNRSFTSPASAFRTAVNPDTGRLNVNEFMQVEGYSNVYAIGDCAGGAAKMAYFAGLHADAAGGNILAQINNQAHGTNTPLKPVTLPAYPGSFVSMGPDDGLGQWFNEKGSIIGSFMVVMFKSKELMVGRNWALFGKKKGTSEDVGGSWWSGWFGASADELQKQKHAAKVQTLSSTMQVGSDEEATRIVKHGFESLPVTIGQDHV